MRLIPAVLFLMAVTLLAACSAIPNISPAQDEIEKFAAQLTLEPEMAGLAGKVVTTATAEEQPMGNTVVRLAKVFWNEDHSDGAFVLEGAHSPSTISTPEGLFAFNDVQPGDYVIVVGEVIGIHEILSEPDGKAKIYTVTLGETLNVGTLRVNLTP